MACFDVGTYETLRIDVRLLRMDPSASVLRLNREVAPIGE